MNRYVDDLGSPVLLPDAPRRVVSLVPSLTEAIALSAPGSLVGATEWCTHPVGLSVPRFGGTKNPDVAGILSAAPDVVVTNEEENKPEHVAQLRAAGVPVWVTDVRTVEGALTSLGRLLEALGAGHPAWLRDAEAAWREARPVADRELSALVPVWRRPWMFVGSDTYAGDVLARLGVRNLLADDPERYPRHEPGDLPRPDVVVLPDEPYAFGPDDGPEAFAPAPAACVEGRLLTWYGPAMVDAPARLTETLRGVV